MKIAEEQEIIQHQITPTETEGRILIEMKDLQQEINKLNEMEIEEVRKIIESFDKKRTVIIKERNKRTTQIEYFWFNVFVCSDLNNFFTDIDKDILKCIKMMDIRYYENDNKFSFIFNFLGNKYFIEEEVEKIILSDDLTTLCFPTISWTKDENIQDSLFFIFFNKDHEEDQVLNDLFMKILNDPLHFFIK